MGRNLKRSSKKAWLNLPMLEMTVTTKIVIAAAIVLLLGGYLYMRQHAKELARKYKTIQRQKFKSKEPVIIEEIIAQLNGATSRGHKNSEQKLQPSFAGNPVSVGEGKEVKAPIEPTTISTPVRLPHVKQIDHHNLSKQNVRGQAQQTETNRSNLATRTHRVHRAPELPQTPIITKSAKQVSSLQERLSQEGAPQQQLSMETKSDVKPPMMPPPPNPTAKSVIEEIQLIDIDLPRFVKEPATNTNKDNPSGGEFAENYPVRGQGKTTSIGEELLFKEDETLYTHINDYAKWVAQQSNHFTLEYYVDNTLVEVIPLIFNSEELARLNGHWFEMFRPLDLNDLLGSIDKSNSAVYCSFSRADVEHLCKPALQILAYVEFEASSRYEKVLEECALKEFVNFLQELKTMANQED